MKINSDEFNLIINDLNIQFNKFCTLALIPNTDGTIYYLPQKRYNNIYSYPYLNDVNENTVFCKFKTNLPNVKGVYLWVVNNEIIYIGESVNLRSRFNNGYGNISPRNCFYGGQNTNVRMNKIALSYLENEQPIDIYICQTTNYKYIEKSLLNKINTKYNIQLNN